jgi:ABC-type multidrug transport system fused ATPase/permease subunit
MSGTMKMSLALAAVLAIAGPVWPQQPEADIEEKARQTLDSARETAVAAAEAVDKSDQAQEVSAGILRPIYRLAEAFSFPAFHWIAFAVMVAGVASFALQLTLGKLVVLARLGFSPAEILSDGLGLVVSLVGLVLTTQAAAENSSFTSSAAAVLSATAVGAIAGFVFYLWGQRQELQAVEGRKRSAAADPDRKEK